MKLSKQFTAVTTFSKFAAMILFIVFPFIGFIIGISYQAKIDTIQNNFLVHSKSNINQAKIPQKYLDIKPFKQGWTVFKDNQLGLSLPPSWYVTEQNDSGLTIVRGDEPTNSIEDPASHELYLLIGKKQYIGDVGLTETKKTTWLGQPATIQQYNWESNTLVLTTEVNGIPYQFALRSNSIYGRNQATEKFLQVASTIQLLK